MTMGMLCIHLPVHRGLMGTVAMVTPGVLWDPGEVDMSHLCSLGSTPGEVGALDWGCLII